MLKAENVMKRYGSQTAVNGVSLELEDDAVTVIVGESGSGKSTLARILSLIEKPDSGRILLVILRQTAGTPSRTDGLCSLLCRTLQAPLTRIRAPVRSLTSRLNC